MCFVGGPEMWETNPRWWTAAILKNWRNCAIFCNCLTDFVEILQCDASETSATPRPLRFLEFENSRWCPAAMLKNQNIAMSP